MKKKIIVTVIAVLLVVLTIGAFLYIAKNGKVKTAKGINYHLSENEIYNKMIDTKLNVVEIEATSGEIHINKSQENNFKVVVYGEKEKDLKVTNEAGKLKIAYIQEQCHGVCVNKEIAKIEVSVPEDYSNSIDINNNYGDVIIDELKNASIKVKEDAGNVEIKEARIIAVKNNLGNITVDKAQTLDAKESSGSIKVGEVADVQAKNEYGEIKIEKITSSAQIKNACGEIKINDLQITKSSNIKNNLGSIKIEKTNDLYIDAKADMGNIKINKNNENSDIKLTIETDMGDIKVNN